MIAIWIAYSILCAVFLSMSDFFVKKYSSGIGTVETAFGRTLFSLPVLWIFAFIDGMPPIDPGLYRVFAMSLPLELAAVILYIQSIRISPLSLTVPLLSFTPVFLLITSTAMMNERPTLYGSAGVLFIVAGAYVLHFRDIRRGLLTPFKMILREKGALMMLSVSAIYSITSNFGKQGVLMSSPAFFAASYFSLLSLLLLVIVAIYGDFRKILDRRLVIIGMLSSVMITFHMLAIRIALVSYMIALKRSSLLFSVLLGAIFLREKGLKERLIGGSVMMAGILIISFFG